MKSLLQTESSECGLACLAMVASHYGYHTDLADLRRQFSISLKGATLAQLMRHASAMQLSARPLRLELEELDQLALPCILHWNLNHFVVLKKITKNWQGKVTLILLDPAVGERRVALQEASAHFTGVACELSPSASFKPKDERKKIAIRDLTGHIVGLRRAIVQVMVLALALEIFAITSPLFNQFVVDEVIVSGDRELLTVLVIGFALLMVTQTAISLARSWFLMRWSMDISFQWSSRVFAHLTHLPVSFFEKRHLGDVVSRFGSIGAIQSTLTSLFVESALDGLMALLALGMMLLYSVKLSALVIVTVLVYAVLRWVFYQPFREASQERLVLSSKESSHFLETIRAISPLKLFGREEERRARWLNLKMDVQNRDIKTQKMSILFKISNTTLFGIQSLALFYIGAGQVMQNVLTVGMLMAFSSYASTFSGRFFNVIDLVVNLKMLGLHSERLADIVLEEAEIDTVQETDMSRIQPTITLKNLKFRYAEGEPWVLDGINLTIPAGQSIALVGPSGCGKTTLCKIILGLLKPTEGEVLIDNIPTKQLGINAYRKLIGTVMQDDVLMAGSIQDNISFFDAHTKQEQVEHCARQAAIHEDIAAMPMGYQTLVGDMGSSLSGGQKQRVLLARALYKQPKILALDEATSHLDVQNEQKVNQALGTLNLTRIMVAHRPETIASAERVVSLQNGKAVEIRATSIDRAELKPDQFESLAELQMLVA
ncbi:MULTISPECIES: peptidase domain-containing ABC transporter [unclassified Undibacterium]|uniref:peptidase domain-containing ABC transporter n=3 Tax=Undibacterium TaxID=401469 RepID=UPI002AC8C108|nr:MULTISPECIES: peptidase domain-containing ABC transporter [unclassified Undibacterium]MEB0141153.1 peptidase domain-containing ABC transporter [Undibacterium sp. CCC2.1]MEB0174186.1 peptidase domain-containing ABC transporter [Undibacterium sp. CCC1.1]MEB0178128.1 peptidase domain-containing ABC transporter [Undibacterium sp. CCC3.4]MEB0217438.1 peptidase domain-containing ABC transporter [Undibacterium sp. 5I2]WPX43010.1 peptidase domain-containing ABC transporter [Undibacterium sp. CCC3.4